MSAPPATEQQIRSTLLQDVIELTARTEQAAEEFETVMGQIPSGLPHPDGVQQIKNASDKLSTARNELMKASLRVTWDETMMVVALFVEVMPIHNHMIDAPPHSSAGPTEAALL